MTFTCKKHSKSANVLDGSKSIQGISKCTKTDEKDSSPGKINGDSAKHNSTTSVNIDENSIPDSSSVKKKKKEVDKSSNYYKKRMFLDESLETMVKDLKAAIKGAESNDIDIDTIKQRRYTYWKDHGGIGKKDLSILRSKCEKIIKDDEERLVAIRNTVKSSKRMITNHDDNKSPQLKKKKKKNRWLKLFVPYYEQGAIDFDNPKYCKEVPISEAEMDDED